MRVLITILDDVTETSMPFNEFVMYRCKHYHDEKQILILCSIRQEVPKVEIPENIGIIYTGRKLYNIRRVIKNVINESKKQNIPYVVHMHQTQSGFLAETAMMGTGFRKKVLFTVHSTFSGYKLHNKFLSFINTLLAQQIICVSNTSYQDYPQFIKRIKGERIQPIQNGVDTERIDQILPVQMRKRKETNFIYVARFVPVKNHKFLVDVLKMCDKNVRFIFVGEEDSKHEVREKAEKLGIANRIRFTGLIPRATVFKELYDADYYISSSTLEGLPVSVLEAMYCGLPCILSDIPQHQEVAGKETLILPLDVKKWAAELNRLIKVSKEQKEQQSCGIREYVAENFSLEKMHEKYDVVYEKL